MTDAGAFAELDALLDQALDLEPDARAAFVDKLPGATRTRVLKLLKAAQAVTLGAIAEEAGRTYGRLAAKTSADDGAAGRWRLLRELGSGGMGQVFYAERREPGEGSETHGGYEQRAAVKILWAHRSDPDVRARFYRERRILAGLDHPGLARFLDGGFLADGRPWFAMEYVDGVHITEHAATLTIDERIELFTAVCNTVAYAHEQLIVHRDIKPQNVLVDRSGRPRLLDFGVASLLGDADDDGVRTRTQGGPLTLQYASPEQLTGAHVSVTSDVYQLGLLLYELLTGQRAQAVADLPLQEALRHIREVAPPVPSRVAPGGNRDLDAIVMTALAKAPQARYRSATLLAADLQRNLAGRPVSAVPPSRWYEVRLFVRRHLLAVGASLTAALALTAATAVSIHLAQQASAAADRSATARQILADVFSMANPFAAGGAEVTLADALVRARPKIEAQVADDPELAWEVHRSLAEIYEKLGLVTFEADAYREMRMAAERTADASGARLLLAVAGYGGTLTRTDPGEAVTHFAAEWPPGPENHAQVEAWLLGQYNYIGALTRLRRYEAAIEEARRMEQVIEHFEVTDARSLGRLHQHLAGVVRRAGDAEREGYHWQQNVRYMREANEPAALAVALGNRAIYLGRMGAYEQAEVAFREAIAVYEAADHADPFLAGIMRGYGGLQFRMGKTEAAIATTRQALALLDPETQDYARFVAELNLVRYTLVQGDGQALVDAMLQTLNLAHDALADPEAVERVLGPFAKFAWYAGEPALAAAALGLGNCEQATLLSALAPHEDPAEADARATINGLLTTLADQPAPVNPEQLQTTLERFVELRPAFYDVLDDYLFLEQLQHLSAPSPLPAKMAERWRTLQVNRVEAQRVFRDHDTELSGYAPRFADATVKPALCGDAGALSQGSGDLAD